MSGLDLLLLPVALLALVAAALAPIEALGWWAGWSDDDRDLRDTARAIRTAPDRTPPVAAPHFAVFLTGIAGITGDAVLPPDRAFLERLRVHLPDCVIVHDVFPYSVDNRGLTGGRRRLARVWRWLDAHVTAEPDSPLRWAVNFRNVLQVAVSADRRYGPAYNLGVAAEILLGLSRHGYRLGSGVPLTLIGSSGGAQIALGACDYLGRLIPAPVQIVSIGGTLSDDPGIEAVDRLDHLHGTHDLVPRIVAALYPGRWPFVFWSPWNRAVQRGTVVRRDIGAMNHEGSGGYFGSRRLPDGQTHAEHTAAACGEVVRAFLASVAPMEKAAGEAAPAEKVGR